MNLSNCSFTRGPRIGKGGYGTIHTVTNPLGQEFVGKYQSLNQTDVNTGLSTQLLVEIDALVRLRNVPEVIQIEGICYQQYELIIILEKMDTDLHNYIQNTETSVRLAFLDNLTRSMVRATALFELLNIVHLDIKPPNILVRNTASGPIFKMTDFGLSRKSFSNLTLAGTFFTSWYRPPEFLVPRDRETFSPFPGDIWSLGLSILEYIIGEPVIRGKTEPELLNQMNFLSFSNLDENVFREKIRNGTITGGLRVADILQRKNVQVSPQIIQILEGMLKLNPDERLTATQILSMMGESISPEYLQQFIPPEYPRQVDPRGIQLITSLMRIQNMGKIPTLIAIEIYTRFFYLLERQRHCVICPPDDAFALAALQIAERLFYRITTSEILSHYQRIGGRNVSVRQIGVAEKIILTLINFSIYNLNLGPVIDRAYSQNVVLENVPPENFSEPLNRWFSSSNVLTELSELIRRSFKTQTERNRVQDLQRSLGLTDFSVIQQLIPSGQIREWTIRSDLQHLAFDPNVIASFRDIHGREYLVLLYYQASTHEIFPPHG